MRKVIEQFLPIFILVVAVLGGVFFLWPAYEDFSGINTQVNIQQERLERGQRVLTQLVALQRQIAERQEEFEKLEYSIPEDMQLPAVYDLIQQLAASSGLVVETITTQSTEVAGESLDIVHVEVQLVGSYAGLKNFLDAAKRSARIVNVGTLHIIAAAQPGAQSALAIEAEIAAYANTDNP